MPPTVTSGRIHTSDIEELNHAVWPWELRMQQLSGGAFCADLDFAQVDGIFMTHERWSRRISAIGATPRGYLALGGACNERGFTYAGEKIDERRVTGGFDATDIEFATPDDEEHWVLLVPTEMLACYLGDWLEPEVLKAQRSFATDPQIVRQLGSLIVRCIAKLRGGGPSDTDGLFARAIQSQVLGSVAELLLCAETDADRASSRSRFLACRRAMRYGARLDRAISVDALATMAGASRRSLELGFREALGISPQRYLHLVRLNHFHRDLRRAARGRMTVTDAAARWGFTELGRAAGEYRRLFGECPSTTLARNDRIDTLRLADVIA